MVNGATQTPWSRDSEKARGFLADRLGTHLLGQEHICTCTAYVCPYFIFRRKIMSKKVGIIMGSDSDLPIIKKATDMLKSLDIPFEVHQLNYVAEEKRLVDVYNAVNIFAIPSLQDNLPNTIVEAMACGIPCIGFNVGGIPEMIDHLHNGYVAEYKNVNDFAQGIHWLLTEGEYELLSREASRKAANTYGENNIAMKYISIYKYTSI